MNMQEMRNRAKEIKAKLHNIGVKDEVRVVARTQAYGIERCHFMCKKLDDAMNYNGGAVAGEHSQILAYEHLAKRHLFQLEKLLERARPDVLARAERVCRTGQGRAGRGTQALPGGAARQPHRALSVQRDHAASPRGHRVGRASCDGVDYFSRAR